MNWLTGISILGGVSLACWLLGAWLGSRLGTGAGERIAWSVLGGLAILLLTASLANAFLPLHGPAAWACLLPALLSLRPALLGQGLRDARALFFQGRGAALVAGATLFLALLLWPLLSVPGAIFYDGTTNHDAFFWITGAEYLQHHPYLAPPPPIDYTHPLMNLVGAITGWRPIWGRMGAEGYLALTSSLSTQSPLLACLWSSAALYGAWLAAVFLVTRTFLCHRLSWPAVAALAALQPLFAFFHHNSNLPNLLGMISGAGLVLATEQALRTLRDPSAPRWPGLLATALTLHGLLCTYPEMVPFIGLPCLLLLWRAVHRGLETRALAWVLAGFALGVALNPATTARAASGFWHSFAIARANENWANILASVSPGGFFPALLTLSAKSGRELGDIGGALLTLAAVAAVGFTWWRARDRLGIALALSGAGVLAAYTLATGFHYGWQKTVQFSAIFLAAILPVGAIELLLAAQRRRRVARAAAAGVVAFFVYAAVIVELDLLKWSARKMLHADWLALRATVRAQLPDAPLVVEPATFERAFFHGMWATYFLRDAAVYFPARGEQNGGYLRTTLAAEESERPPQAVLVGRNWADTLDANSPRLATGREFVLVGRANRVREFSGFAPVSGAPQSVAPRFSLTLVPHSASVLHVAIGTPADTAPAGEWRLAVKREGAASTPLALPGTASVWRGEIPLVAGVPQQITGEFVPAAATVARPDEFPLLRFEIRSGPER